ncbi:MFS transporter [Modestobacter marinus]|uniref:EmrB/QacA subfamily drug resistance transporter n=1 Tax=Modestobacter marinus TaxID=477641 RepID=A0A846LEN7_9ACTN|nr:MFS transporter [Modestobacter marinus]NIH65661.1 EmrB/QacA subfamily drug resistance transporter [Modestobacter marinus]GGL66126.1 MFS transporter [Modestobacter marinus]
MPADSTTTPPGVPDLPPPAAAAPAAPITSALPPTVPDVGPDPRRWLALAVIAVAQLMVVLDASIVNIALPDAGIDLGITAANIQWVVTAYTLAFGGLLLLGGRVADFIGRKRAFLIGLAGFAGASALGGLAPNQELLFAARALQGGFAALLAPAALSLLAVTFTDPKERARAFGVFGAISGGGAAIGLILGGVLTEYASWRWTLGVNVPIALVTAVFAIGLITESRAEGDRRYDVPGVLLSTAGLVSLVYGFSKAAEEGVGWTDPVTLGLLAAAAVLLVSFVLYERRASHPLLPLRVVLDRNRGGSYLVFLLVGAGIFAIFLFLTFYFQQTLGYSPLESGFAFLPFSGGIILGAGIVSQVLPRVGPRPLIIGGLLLAAVGMLWLTGIGETSSYVTEVLPAELAISLGMAAVFVPASSTALVGVESHDAGIASAVLNTSQQVGGSLGLALLNTFYASAVTGYLADNPGSAPGAAFVHGYHVAFVWAAVFLAVALVISVVLIRAKKDDLPAEMALAA